MNLPTFLKASANGRVEGTPDKKGTFTITVSYGQGKTSR